MGGEVDGDQVERAGFGLPLDEDEVFGGRIFGPGGPGFEKFGAATSYRGELNGREELIIDLGDFGKGRFNAAASELNGQPAASAGELALVEETHAGQAQDDEGRSAVFGGAEDGSDAALVVVFEKMSAAENNRGGRRAPLPGPLLQERRGSRDLEWRWRR